MVTENVSLDAFVGIAPGDSKVEKISIKNESDDLYDFYILEETVKALEAAGMKRLSLKLYPTDRHEVLNELDRDKVMGDIACWINENVMQAK